MSIKENIINRRYKTHCKSAEKYGRVPLDFGSFSKIFDRPFKCEYCGVDLVWKGELEKVVSIDHKIPYAHGGDNHFGNLALCCYQCNIVKGTLIYTVYLRLLEALKEYDKSYEYSLFDDYMEQRMKGSIANKMEREYGKEDEE